MTSEVLLKESSASEHFDVLIVGAGVSGIGSACHLLRQCPDRNFIILEAQESFGGTWLTHRYPGVRADSDLYTYSYSFKPWLGDITATGEEILNYLSETIDEHNLADSIRYRHTIESASWSSIDSRWTVIAKGPDGDCLAFTCNFLWMCQGYYRHDKGYMPEWAGMSDFRGQIVHAQEWPQDLDYRDKRVIVIGSGATAATLIPAMATDCSHITMLQRSPTYFSTGFFGVDLAKELKELGIDPAWIHEIMRRKSLRDEAAFNKRSITDPETVKQELLNVVRDELGADFDIETHFTPRYRPWRQRLAYVPDGDLFKAMKAGKASVATGEIARFTRDGVLLRSGETLEADIVVTATGFHLSVMGGISFAVDDHPIDFAKTVTYHGMMFTGVPNLAWVFGYLRASWTPRVDVVADFVCRLLNHMSARGFHKVAPERRPSERDLPLGPWIDPENFNAGYLIRSLHLLPKTGSTPEWRHTQDYLVEKDSFAAIVLDDCPLCFS